MPNLDTPSSTGARVPGIRTRTPGTSTELHRRIDSWRSGRRLIGSDCRETCRSRSASRIALVPPPAKPPACRVASPMVTSHLRPGTRAGRPGRESNPGFPLSQCRTVIQTQGAPGNLGNGCDIAAGILRTVSAGPSSREGAHRAPSARLAGPPLDVWIIQGRVFGARRLRPPDDSRATVQRWPPDGTVSVADGRGMVF